MALKFGTDGLRGEALSELRLIDAYALGRAAAQVFEAKEFFVGGDPRESTPALAAAFACGVAKAGANPKSVGLVPTPALAWMSAKHLAPAAMISASHNPYTDNGIKLFSAGGMKLSDEQEQVIQTRYTDIVASVESDASKTEFFEEQKGAAEWGNFSEAFELGEHHPNPEVAIGWIKDLVTTAKPHSLSGLKLVLDASNGAAYQLAALPFEQLGADVTVIGNQPNGQNINKGCGSTNTASLAKKVVELNANAGLGFDGDADRLIAVDETGQIVDGDQVIALLAKDWAKADRLNGNQVVVTVMSNLGFHRAMKEAGIGVVVTGVGDRNVLHALDEKGLSLGGEQSGHVICRDYATTGDGILAGVQLLALLAAAGEPLSLLAGKAMQTVPQILENVRLASRTPNAAELIADDVKKVEASFGDDGRVLVRPSGTEPLLRIMVEHLDHATAEKATAELVAAAKTALG